MEEEEDIKIDLNDDTPPVTRFHCNHCMRSFAAKHDLEDHMAQNHLGASENPPPVDHPYTLQRQPVPCETPTSWGCDVCEGVYFRTQPALLRHYSVRHGEDADLVQCRSVLARLRSLPANNGKPRCFLCGRPQGSMEVLVEHLLASHLKLARYTCNLCSGTFKRQSIAVGHMFRNHLGCDPAELTENHQIRRMLDDQGLINHSHHHGKMKLIIQYFMRKHHRKEHGVNRIAPLIFTSCETADTLFCDFSSLQHFQCCHMQSLVCEVCNHSILQDALQSVDKLGPYVKKWEKSMPPGKLMQLYKQFSQESKRKHALGQFSRTKTPDLQCSYCSFTSTEREGIEKHLRLSHGRGRLFECSVCEERFGDQSLMEVHWHLTHWRCKSRPRFTVIHCTKEYGLPCRFCYRVYPNEPTLAKHVTEDHVLTYTCTHAACTFVTSNNTAMRSHLNIMHKEKKFPSIAFELSHLNNNLEGSKFQENFNEQSQNNNQVKEIVRSEPGSFHKEIVEIDGQGPVELVSMNVEPPYPKPPSTNIPKGMIFIEIQNIDDVESYKLDRPPHVSTDKISPSSYSAKPLEQADKSSFICYFCGVAKHNKSDLAIHISCFHFQHLYLCGLCTFHTHIRAKILSHLKRHIFVSTDHTYSLRYHIQLQIKNWTENTRPEDEIQHEAGNLYLEGACSEKTVFRENLMTHAAIQDHNYCHNPPVTRLADEHEEEFSRNDLLSEDSISDDASSSDGEASESEPVCDTSSEDTDSEPKQPEFQWKRKTNKQLIKAEKSLAELRKASSRIEKTSRNEKLNKYVCYICSALLRWRTELVHHVFGRHYRLRRLFCFYCSYSGFFLNTLKRHISDVHKKPEKYLEIRDMEEVFKLHVENTKLTAKILLSAFRSGKVKSLSVEPAHAELSLLPYKKKLTAKTISNTCNYVCKFCTEKFESENQLRSHLNVKIACKTVRPLRCKIEEFILFRLRKHPCYELSSMSKLYSKKTCTHTISTARRLMSHFRSHHKDQVRCLNPKCRAQVVFSSELGTPGDLCLAMWEYELVKQTALDIKQIYSEFNKTIKCFKCESEFLSLPNLATHLHRKHYGIKYFKCMVCPFSAHTRQCVVRHCCLVHKNSPSACSVTEIDYKFSWLRNVQCEHCDAKFYTRKDLVKHMSFKHAEGSSSENYSESEVDYSERDGSEEDDSQAGDELKVDDSPPETAHYEVDTMTEDDVKIDITESYQEIISTCRSDEEVMQFKSEPCNDDDGAKRLKNKQVGKRVSRLRNPGSVTPAECSGQVTGRSEPSRPRVKVEQDQLTSDEPFWLLSSVKQEPDSDSEFILSSGEMAPLSKRRRVTFRPYPDSLPPVPRSCLPCSVQL